MLKLLFRKNSGEASSHADLAAVLDFLIQFSTGRGDCNIRILPQPCYPLGFQILLPVVYLAADALPDSRPPSPRQSTEYGGPAA